MTGCLTVLINLDKWTSPVFLKCATSLSKSLSLSACNNKIAAGGAFFKFIVGDFS